MSAQFDIENILKNTRVQIERQDGRLSLHIETERLLIRPVMPEDVAFYQERLWGDAKVMQFFGAGQLRLHKDEDSKRAGKVDYAQNRIVDSESSWCHRWDNNNPYSGMTVCLKSTAKPIGHLVCGGGELAYMFVPEVWQNRYASEAVTAYVRKVLPALILAGYQPKGVEKILATCSPDNRASQVVLDRAGLRINQDAVRQREFGGQRCDKLEFEKPIAALLEEHLAREALQSPPVVQFALPHLMQTDAVRGDAPPSVTPVVWPERKNPS